MAEAVQWCGHPERQSQKGGKNEILNKKYEFCT
jgi:hypothetical protein